MSSNTNNLEETARNFLIEQKMNSVAQWEKRKKPDIDTGSHKPASSSPNSLEEEDSVEESTDGLGANHKPIKTKYKGTLGALEMRNWRGNQKRTSSTYNMSQKLSEAREKSFAKVSKKKESEKQENTNNKNKTDTGQSPDFVDFRPNKNELTNN
jgi:hypothetical protein